MPALTPRELAVRERLESLIALAAPALDLLLAAGDRVSRLAGGNDTWEAPRSVGLGPEARLPRAGE